MRVKFPYIHAMDFIIVLSLWFAMMLQLLPMPSWLYAFKPDVVAMVWFYWVLRLAKPRSIMWAFVLSLWMDALLSYPFGCHGLGYMVMTFVALKFHLQIRMFPLWQQSVVVASMLFLERLLSYAITGFFVSEIAWGTLFTVVITHLLLWPWLHHVFHALANALFNKDTVG